MTSTENETPDERALRRLKSYLDELPMPQKAAAARIIQNAEKGRFTAGWQDEAEEIVTRHVKDRYGM
jgi:hypothetical protein